MARNSSVTIDDIMCWQPCSEWTRERIEKYARGRQRITLRGILSLPKTVTRADVLWLAMHEPLITQAQARIFAADFAEHALLRERAAGREPHADSWAAVSAARQHARGEISDEQLSAAHSAADSAAYSARRAVRSAAYSARLAAYSARLAAYWAAYSARLAARSTAYSAARGAARSAADSAAYSAAGLTERR